MHSLSVRGAEPPYANEFMEIWVDKSMETSNFLGSSNGNVAIF